MEKPNIDHNLIKLLSIKLWDYFNEYIHVVTKNEWDFKETVTDDLIAKNFKPKEIEKIMNVFNKRLVGQQITESIDTQDLAVKIVVYTLVMSSEDMLNSELRWILHDYQMDSLTGIGKTIIDAYNRDRMQYSSK